MADNIESTTRKKILLIEDDPDMGQFYLDLLRGEYEIDQAFDGEEGWQKLINGKYDLVLLDIMMPKLDGLSLLQRKNTQIAAIKNVPVVIITNLGQDGVLKECFDLGAKYCILKAETAPNQIPPILEKALL